MWWWCREEEEQVTACQGRAANFEFSGFLVFSHGTTTNLQKALLSSNSF
jgi:hypothetical protein